MVKQNILPNPQNYLKKLNKIDNTLILFNMGRGSKEGVILLNIFSFVLFNNLITDKTDFPFIKYPLLALLITITKRRQGLNVMMGSMSAFFIYLSSQDIVKSAVQGKVK